MKDTVSVTEDRRDGDLAGSVLLVSESPALPEENLAGVLEDVARTEPGHGDDPLATLGGAGEVVLAGGRAGSHRETGGSTALLAGAATDRGSLVS